MSRFWLRDNTLEDESINELLGRGAIVVEGYGYLEPNSRRLIGVVAKSKASCATWHCTPRCSMRRLTRSPDGTVRVDFDACEHLDFTPLLPNARVVLLARASTPCWRLERPLSPPLASKYVQRCGRTGDILGAPLACTRAVYALCEKYRQGPHSVALDAELIDVDDVSAETVQR